MRGDELPKRLALYVAVFHHQIIAGREIFVEVLQHPADIVVGVFDDEPGMRRCAKEFSIEQVLRIGAVAFKYSTPRMLRRDLHPVDRVNAAFDAAERQMIGEPDGAGSEARARLRIWFADAARRSTPDTWRNRRRSSSSGMPRQRMSDGTPWHVSSTSAPNSVPNRG